MTDTEVVDRIARILRQSTVDVDDSDSAAERDLAAFDEIVELYRRQRHTLVWKTSAHAGN